jgi:dTMP kinase
LKKGLFITFEGPDGSGKSTQAQSLASRLQEEGYRVLLTREPGGTKLGEAVREILLGKAHQISQRTEALLYAVARAQHVEEKLIPALARGQIVICDRFVDSSLAYQGYGLGMCLSEINQINSFATGGLKPDLTFLLDLSPQEGLARARQDRGQMDRIEERDLQFHTKVRQGFLELAKQESQRFRVIQTQDRCKEEVAASIWEETRNVL